MAVAEVAESGSFTFRAEQGEVDIEGVGTEQDGPFTEADVQRAKDEGLDCKLGSLKDCKGTRPADSPQKAQEQLADARKDVAEIVDDAYEREIEALKDIVPEVTMPVEVPELAPVAVAPVPSLEQIHAINTLPAAMPSEIVEFEIDMAELEAEQSDQILAEQLDGLAVVPLGKSEADQLSEFVAHKQREGERLLPEIEQVREQVAGAQQEAAVELAQAAAVRALASEVGAIDETADADAIVRERIAQKDAEARRARLVADETPEINADLKAIIISAELDALRRAVPAERAEREAVLDSLNKLAQEETAEGAAAFAQQAQLRQRQADLESEYNAVDSAKTFADLFARESSALLPWARELLG